MTYQPPPNPYGSAPHPPGYGLPPQPGGARLQPPARNNRALIWIIGGVVSVLVLCGGGIAVAAYAYGRFLDDAPARPAPGATFPGDGPRYGAPSPTPRGAVDLKLGETLVLTDDEGARVEITVANAKARRKGCSRYATPPDDGGYLVADATVHVVEGPFELRPYAFGFLAPDSSTRDNDGSAGSGCGNPLDSVTLRAGDKRRGQLVFDVWPGKGHITFQEAGGEIAGKWRVG